MTRDKILRESKNYLLFIHEALRKAFRSAPLDETVFIYKVLDDIEKGVTQLETLEEMLKAKIKKDKNLEEIIEE